MTFRIDHVTLAARDPQRMAAFYEAVLGLTRRTDDAAGGDSSTVALGTVDATLLRLVAAPAARPARADEPGLFHTAFLLPARADLGAFLAHAHALGVRFEGAADHAVSEALYLSDPEGNGVEVYWDRPREAWQISGERIRIVNEPLNNAGLQAEAGAWTGAPRTTVIGHVHLKVSALARADGIYRNTLGAALTQAFERAHFYGLDGYHHTFAANIWHSDGVPAGADRTGLVETATSAGRATFDAIAARGAERDGERLVVPDGAGGRITIRPA